MRGVPNVCPSSWLATDNCGPNVAMPSECDKSPAYADTTTTPPSSAATEGFFRSAAVDGSRRGEPPESEPNGSTGPSQVTPSFVLRQYWMLLLKKADVAT